MYILGYFFWTHRKQFMVFADAAWLFLLSQFPNVDTTFRAVLSNVV